MHKQRGMVLIIAMLIVVLVVSITVSLTWRFNLSLTRSENRWHGLQAYSYLQGAETLASVVLQEDAREDQQKGRMVDSLDELWAQPADAFPTDEGWVKGQLEDAQGRFNINLLQQHASGVDRDNANIPLEQRFTASQKRFIRLLQTFELEDGPMDQMQAIEITEAVIDWIDVDRTVMGFGGAEADYYEQLEPPTTPPDLSMASVSELSRIKGITPEIYQALLPLVIALPPDAKLNINTMPMALMRTMAGNQDFTPLEEADAQLLIEERDAMGGADEPDYPDPNDDGGASPSAGYDNVQAFEASPTLAALVNATGGFDSSDLDVQSRYFLLFSETQVGEQLRSGASMLLRQNDQVRVIRRSDANF